MAARMRFESATLWMEGTELTTEAPCPSVMLEERLLRKNDGQV